MFELARQAATWAGVQEARRVDYKVLDVMQQEQIVASRLPEEPPLRPIKHPPVWDFSDPIPQPWPASGLEQVRSEIQELLQHDLRVSWLCSGQFIMWCHGCGSYNLGGEKRHIEALGKTCLREEAGAGLKRQRARLRAG